MVDGVAEQVTNALYRVDAEFNPYAYWEIGGQPLYYMVMTEAERGRLAYLGTRRDHGLSHARMNGTFISVDGQDILLRYNVGIRNRGNGSRIPPPNNYHVDFPSDRLWKDVSGININSKYTYIQLLGHTVFHMAGLPALNAKRVQVRVNGEDLAPMDPERMYGSYVHLEVYDSDWADAHLPDDSQGNLYRCVSRSRYCDLRYRGDDPTVYGLDDRYAKKTNAGVNDWSDLIALNYTLDEGPDETYVEDVEAVVDVEQWLRWLAVMTFMTNRETNLSNGYGDDYCMYRGAEDARFILLPYDLDSVLSSSDPEVSIWLQGRLGNLPVIERFLTQPEFVPRYYAQLKDLAETVFVPERFNALVEQALGDWVPEQETAAIEDFLAARRAYILSVIPESLTTGSDLNVDAGYHVKDIPYAYDTDIHGTADVIETRSVVVSGRPVEWLPQEGQWTLGSTLLDLFSGINRLVVETFDGPDGTGRTLDQGYADLYYRTNLTNDYPKEMVTDESSSAVTEFYLNVIARNSYVPTIPILVRVELLNADGSVNREVWDATATLSVTDNETIELSTSECALYNGMGSAFVLVRGSGDFTLTVTVGDAQADVFLTDVSDESLQIVSGTLRESQRWSGVYRITGGDLTIPEGVTLTLSPGTLVLVDGIASGSGGTDIDVRGSIQSLGTARAPVTFTALAAGRNWGELHFVDALPSTFVYTNITQAGHSPSVGHSNSGPTIRVSNSSLTFEHASLTDNDGKIMDTGDGTELVFHHCLFARSVMGPEITGTALRFEDSWITEMAATDDADGIYIHDQLAGQECLLTRSVVAVVDDDGIDTLGSEVTIADCLVRDCKDKGVSVYGGETTIDRCLVVGNNTAPEDPTIASIAAKAFSGGEAVVNIDHTTVVTCKTPGYVDVGLQSHNKYGYTSGTIVYNVTNSIIDATDPIDVQEPYLESDVHVSYSDLVGETWPGAGNISVDPRFVNPLLSDYRLAADSPCLGVAAPDSTLENLGYYQDEQNGTSEAGGDLVWTANDGPYRITSDMTIAAGATLTIGPGTTVFFDPDVTLTIRGQLVAEGTEYALIRLTRTPDSAGVWGGLQFVDSVQGNRISHAVIEYGQTDMGMIGLENSQLLLDHVTLDHTDLCRIRSLDSSLIVRHCHFTDVVAPGEPPTRDNRSEHIWGSGVPPEGQFIIEDNVFGRTPGHNDAIDFAGATRPAAIPQIRNNVFTGGGDDALDLETDAHIEGNVFIDYIKDAYNTTPRESNAISAGGGKDYVVVRNVFYHVQHVAQIKDQSFMQFESNTVVDANAPVCYFEIPGQTMAPGRGVWIDSCIFADCPELLDAFYVNDARWGTTDIIVNRSLVPSEWHVLGEGNVDADPLFVSAEDFHLQSISPARGTGRCDLDMGAYVPEGASVGGGPVGWTHRTVATLPVWGPGITDYRYSLNDPDGPWSEAYPTEVPISLTGLGDGSSYTVYILGKNSAGRWQEQANASRTWTVDTGYRRLVLHEILADNETAYAYDDIFPDAVELYYDGPTAMSLAGVCLTDDPAQPDKFVFPAGVAMEPGDYLTVWAGDDAVASDLYLGFGLDAAGDELYLYDWDGTLLDSVTFGRQLPDLSIGRIGSEGGWGLTIPTLGQANVAQPLGDPAGIKINEWLAGAEVLFVADFVEFYNPEAWPVDLGGFHITDNPTTQPDKHELRPLTFVGAQGFAAFEADDSDEPGSVNFGLSTDGEMIGLFDPNLTVVDRVIFGPQTPDVSQGRAPDGAGDLDWFALPTPNVANPITYESVIEYVTLVLENAEKRAIVPLSEDHVDETWMSDPSFDDSTWNEVSGDPGGVGYELGAGYEDVIGLNVADQMYQINTSCYVRIPFTVEQTTLDELTELYLSLRYDDGYIIYLNGVEVARDNIAETPQWDSSAQSSHEADVYAFDVVLDLSPYAEFLHAGRNLLAIHGLNTSLTSSDFLISVALGSTVVESVGSEHPYLKELELLDGLRVTELMYHAQDGDAGDYIELQNIGGVSLDLTGLRFTDGVEFVFPALTLEPGDYTVVVADAAQFGSAYGTNVSVAGQYGGRLSDRGEDVVLRLPEPWEAAIMRFRYEDSWYPGTDGDGRSLEIEELTAAPVTWNDPENWHSAQPTPGGP